MKTDPVDRRIPLEGVYNMRDLGGLQTLDGRLIKPRRIFRADAMHRLTDADLEILAPFGIRMVIDLRSKAELEAHGASRLVETGATLKRTPILGDDPFPEDSFEIQPTLGEDYRMLARHFPQYIVRAIEEISRPETMPLVFHCASGKNRTGIIAALVLSILGVNRLVIVDDYVMTEAAMPQIFANTSPEELEALHARFPPSYLRADAESISALLNLMDEESGSPEAWLLEAGLKKESIDRLRASMLL